jgi:ankyrin repeat protein
VHWQRLAQMDQLGDPQVQRLLTQETLVMIANKTRSREAERKEMDNSLIYAVKAGQIDKVNWLLSLGADFDFKDRTGAAAIHYAVACGEEMLQTLLARGCDINQATYDDTRDGDTALHVAAATNQAQVARFLIEAGINVGAKNYFARTALMISAKPESKETLNQIVVSAAALGGEAWRKMSQRDQIGNIRVREFLTPKTIRFLKAEGLVNPDLPENAAELSEDFAVAAVQATPTTNI